jgi:BirA family biotin operon repressor/biotin-[acetyl-CoA-carboxylase] ligase
MIFMDSLELQEILKSTGIRQVVYYEETGSTNDDGIRWLDEDAADFSVIVSDLQTSGRGRGTRKWVTEPGSSLAFSVIFKPMDAHIPFLALYSPLGGLAVAQAIEKVTSLQPQIKWPNDVLIDRKKVCGILSEAVWDGSRLKGVVLGIGINIAPSSIPPADQLLFPAACLEIEAGRSVDRWQILSEVLLNLKTWRDQLGSQRFMDAWQERLAFKNEVVMIKQEGHTPMIGILLGVNPQGYLLIQTADGNRVEITVGDVHLRLVELE